MSPRSFETDVTNGATGAVTSTGTKAVGSLAQFASSLGLQASESNLMTLQNLDDQKYQNGMMTPVPLKNIQAFQDEGYQRDLLFMMFLSSVQISGTLVDTIDNAVVARCAQAKAGAGGSISFEKQLCAYIDSAPYQSLFDPGHQHPAAFSFSLNTCRASGSVVGGDVATDMVRFNNDPAREGRRDAAGDPHPEVCFQVLLNDLLVLGLGVGSARTFLRVWSMSCRTAWRSIRNSAPVSSSRIFSSAKRSDRRHRDLQEKACRQWLHPGVQPHRRARGGAGRSAVQPADATVRRRHPRAPRRRSRPRTPPLACSASRSHTGERAAARMPRRRSPLWWRPTRTPPIPPIPLRPAS